MFRFAAFTLGLVFVCSFPVSAKTKVRSWQAGELTFRKTVAMDRGQLRREYVYRIRARDMRYLVVLKEPLHLNLYSPLAFAPTRRHVFIRDDDGNEREAYILQKSR
jgi:hypothetical protein